MPAANMRQNWSVKLFSKWCSNLGNFNLEFTQNVAKIRKILKIYLAKYVPVARKPDRL